MASQYWPSTSILFYYHDTLDVHKIKYSLLGNGRGFPFFQEEEEEKKLPVCHEEESIKLEEQKKMLP